MVGPLEVDDGTRDKEEKIEDEEAVEEEDEVTMEPPEAMDKDDNR